MRTRDALGRTGTSDGHDAEAEPENDEDLVRRIQLHEPDALKVLWNRYGSLLYSQAKHILHNHAESEDVVAEVFEEVWLTALGYRRERAQPVAWLVNLAKRRAIDHLRERQSHDRVGERLQKELQAGTSKKGGAIENQLRLIDLREILDTALHWLPSEQMNTVWMAHYEGLSQREISAFTHTPLGTVKSRLEIGLRKLRQGLLRMDRNRTRKCGEMPQAWRGSEIARGSSAPDF